MAAVLVVVAVAGGMLGIWLAEGRIKPISNIAVYSENLVQANAAKAALNFLDKLAEMRKTLAAMDPADPAYAEEAHQISELQNFIGAAQPALVVGPDSSGNLLIVGDADARRYIDKVISRFEEMQK